MKNIIKEQIFKLLNAKGLSVLAFAQKCNEEHELSIDTVKSICYGRINNPKLETLVILADMLNVSIDFLIGRKTYAEEELRLLRNYRCMSSHGKKFVQAMATFEKNFTDFEEEQEYNNEVDCYLPEVKIDNEIKYVLPCLEPTGVFKDGVLYDTSIKTRIKTHLTNVYMALKIPNDSLANTYFKGDIVFVEERRPNIGEIAIYHKGNHIYIRKYNKDETTGKHILKSLNINNKDIILSSSEMAEYNTLGTCIYIRRKRA